MEYASASPEARDELLPKTAPQIGERSILVIPGMGAGWLEVDQYGPTRSTRRPGGGSSTDHPQAATPSASTTGSTTTPPIRQSASRRSNWRCPTSRCAARRVRRCESSRTTRSSRRRGRGRRSPPGSTCAAVRWGHLPLPQSVLGDMTGGVPGDEGAVEVEERAVLRPAGDASISATAPVRRRSSRIRLLRRPPSRLRVAARPPRRPRSPTRGTGRIHRCR